MVSSRVLWFIAAGGMLVPILVQAAPRVAPIPSDPLELATGEIQPAKTFASRQAGLELLGRAQNNYLLRTAGAAYDLKVTFTVNSGGQTEYDGAWQMEDTFDPNQGLHWSATGPGGYSITEISAQGNLYSEGTRDYIPLRLHEARAALFGPIPSPQALTRAAVRTSTAVFDGAPVTCVLLSPAAKHRATSASGRRWQETEDCIDPQSGLLKVHSQVPGRYYAYDYSNALQFAGHTFPSRVIITEGGKTVTAISVESLERLPVADSGLFVPTPEMKQRGRAIAMAGAEKVWLNVATDAVPAGAAPHVVCVFGLVTPLGQMVEAHSLQPSDPYSAAAVESAKHMSFSPPPRPGEVHPIPQQHFVFVIENFGHSQ